MFTGHLSCNKKKCKMNSKSSMVPMAPSLKLSIEEPICVNQGPLTEEKLQP